MSTERQGNGRFGAGYRANPHGRPRKDRSVNATIMRELTAPVTVTENQKRKSISKLAANAKQVANKGASGDMRAAKMTLDLALKVASDCEATPAAPVLTGSDREIVARFVARLRQTIQQENDHADPNQ